MDNVLEFLSTNHLIIIPFVILAVIFARTKLGWILLALGPVLELAVVMETYLMLVKAHYTNAVAVHLTPIVLLTIAGAVIIKLRRGKKKAPRKQVTRPEPPMAVPFPVEETPAQIPVVEQPQPVIQEPAAPQEEPVLELPREPLPPQLPREEPILPPQPPVQKPAAPAAPAQESTLPLNMDIPPQPQIPQVLLRLTSGPLAGTNFQCEEGATVIMGRDPSRCNLQLKQYSTVSCVHCRVDIHPQYLVVTDLHSSNGTYVNGTRLTPGQSVKAGNGSTIVLADANCTFRVQY